MIRRRPYGSYEEYCRQQVAKLATLDFTYYETAFSEALKERLGHIPVIMAGATVLCLGARTGTECRAFIELGCLAIGIDLNPGASNKYVLSGDFHDIQFADGSFHAAYCNTWDHVFDYDRMLAELRRTLKPNAALIAEIARGIADESGFAPGPYESCWWDKADDVVAEISGRGFEPWARRSFTYPWPGDQVVFIRVP